MKILILLFIVFSLSWSSTFYKVVKDEKVYISDGLRWTIIDCLWLPAYDKVVCVPDKVEKLKEIKL